ncbi:hypothetical protein F3Y22_tig00016065pilonHSYRG00061 [Hibiscus syriacus]|uniref:Uncharacterized protein n=1 Tax=Hibiscus syriacus TaxID=106335 RepID=A0A6A3BXB3_HIBSY|nr:hypothetical protein F3Y22_tig00016065pilonHSYRG00061 [Hibiscus syriacus]
MNSQESFGVTHSDSGYLISDGKMDAQSFQQTNQSALGTFSENFGSSDTINWNQISQGNADYPEHMVFDPQYPGWYYDTIALEWKMLEYTSTEIILNSHFQYALHFLLHTMREGLLLSALLMH